LKTRLDDKYPFVEIKRSKTKSEAVSYANKLRDNGELARVIERPYGYSVYAGHDRHQNIPADKTDVKKTIKPRIETKSYNSEAPGKRRFVKVISVEEDEKFRKLRLNNIFVGTVHLILASLMVIFSNPEFKIAISSTFAAGPPGCINEGLCEQFIINNFQMTIAYWVAAFSFLSASFHYLSAFVFQEYYRKNINMGRNPLRWIEYSLSSTVMILLLMALSGITNLAALIAVSFANISMILFGWISEIMNPPDREKTDWTAFIFGCIAGLGPWIALYGALIINIEQLGVSYSEIPSFVWVILFVQFAFFNVFAVNHALQFIKGFYKNGYFTGELYYIYLSLSAKVVLALLIYVNTLIL
tara:strand:+ start:410 stop:1480 length:1071 start_codon:yes stop_codon:yes gene_type:complete